MNKYRDHINYPVKLRAVLVLTVVAVLIIVGTVVYKTMKHVMSVQNQQIEEIRKQIGE